MNARDLLRKLNEDDEVVSDTDDTADSDDHKEMVMHILNMVARGEMDAVEAQHAIAHIFLTHDSSMSDIDDIVDHIHGKWAPGEDDMPESLPGAGMRIAKAGAIAAGVLGAATYGGLYGHEAADLAHDAASHVLTHAGDKMQELGHWAKPAWTNPAQSGLKDMGQGVVTAGKSQAANILAKLQPAAPGVPASDVAPMAPSTTITPPTGTPVLGSRVPTGSAMDKLARRVDKLIPKW